jgi:methylmalonyl-CoA/ethylmalonyl-CoA epimerase
MGENAARAKGIDHVGLIVRDLEAAVRLYVDVLGAKLVAGGVEHEHNVRSAFVKFPDGSKFELLCPIGPGGMQSFLDSRGEGVHHITLFTGDVVGLNAHIRDAGLQALGLDVTDPVWSEVYVSPKSAHGCLLQLVEPSAGYDIEGHADEMRIDDILSGEWVWKDRAPARATDMDPSA